MLIMRKHILYTAMCALLAAPVFTSCEEMFGNFLDRQPSNNLEEKDVWNSWVNARNFYYDIYNYLRDGKALISNSWMDATTDLAMTSYSWGGARSSFNIGNYYASSGASELKDTWGHYYRGIRKCNKLLENISSVPTDADETYEQRIAQENRFKAEARFFRAYFYWELCLRYGAVPIITESLDPNDDGINDIPRPEISTCFNFILSELSDSYEYLDEIVADADLGRITRGASLALQSRIKLYLASPRYAHLNIVTWGDAVTGAEMFIQRFGPINGLFDRISGDKGLNYQAAVNNRNVDGNKEVIFWRNGGRGDWWRNESPVGYGGNGGNSPSQNLVDMYDMADGSSPFLNYDATGAPVYNALGIPEVNLLSGYSDQDPYSNRDPRFYYSVLHNGAYWWSRPIDTTEGGRDKPTGNANATPTGYYGRKYMDDGKCHYVNGGDMYRNWVFIRYAEVLLNYAEAKNEAEGPSAEVFHALQQLRDRVGMTARLSDRTDLQSKEALRNFIRKERTIELAFEDHRAWDVRRWNVAVEALSRPIYGMEITSKGDNEFSYRRKISQTRVFSENMYLYPIPEEEIWKTGMENNPGW